MRTTSRRAGKVERKFQAPMIVWRRGQDQKRREEKRREEKRREDQRREEKRREEKRRSRGRQTVAVRAPVLKPAAAKILGP